MAGLLSQIIPFRQKVRHLRRVLREPLATGAIEDEVFLGEEYLRFSKIDELRFVLGEDAFRGNALLRGIRCLHVGE
jgi:hypothetical protein